MDRLKEISSDEQARQLARMREVGERDQRSMLKSARQEGLEEGLAEAKKQILKSLLDAPATVSLPDETLAQLVGLPVEQVAAMRRTLAK